MGIRAAGWVLLGVALIIVVVVLYRDSEKSNIPLIFSPAQILNATWSNYKAAYIEPTSGRTLDPSRGDITTSEGESYTMLRAVWLGDKTTFDNSWTFTKDNLQHKSGDKLFAWLYGQEPGGTYGILTDQGGNTTASDADEDIALALTFAYARWQDPRYISAAQQIISDIWANEVMTINGTPYLMADNLEKDSASPVALIDPSYLAPEDYRIFAQVDPAHPWGQLVDSSYQVLEKSISAPLEAGSAGLPPDWIAINKTTGALSAAPAAGNDTNYGYDAMRVPWRLALDHQWFADPRDKNILSKMQFLSGQWKASQSLASTYAHDGSVTASAEAPAMYGTAIGYFMIEDPSAAADLYENKLAFLWDPDRNAWKQELSYYDDNWAWFGIALYNNLLPNLAATLPQSAFTH